MKAKLEFALPAEQQSYEDATLGARYRQAASQFRRWCIDMEIKGRQEPGTVMGLDLPRKKLEEIFKELGLPAIK